MEFLLGQQLGSGAKLGIHDKHGVSYAPRFLLHSLFTGSFLVGLSVLQLLFPERFCELIALRR
jgi:hypothetical protein